MLYDGQIPAIIQPDLGNAGPPSHYRRSPAQFGFSPSIDEQLPGAVQPCGRLLILLESQLVQMSSEVLPTRLHPDCAIGRDRQNIDY